MKRRKFLVSIVKGGAGIVAGGLVLKEIVETVSTPDYPFVASGNIDLSKNLVTDDQTEYKIICEDHSDFKIIYDEETGTISFENPPEEGININELYAFFRDEWKGDEGKIFKIG